MLAVVKRTALLLLCWVSLPGSAMAGMPQITVFPLQELEEARNDVNLPLTRELSASLAAAGNEISSWDTLMTFMAHNRIRTVGHLETFHLYRVGSELGATFVLLGTVSQRKERPIPALGLTLQLVRTNDARTVWSYVGHVSTADARRLLGIGEPRSLEDLQQLLIKDVLAQWPWRDIGQAQEGTEINIDSMSIQPEYVQPGEKVSARVRFRDQWLPDRTPQVFFRVGEQFHPATPTGIDGTYEASWPAAEEDGRSPVTVIREWPLYQRRESASLGNYVVDGQPPVLELALKGGLSREKTAESADSETREEIPVFNRQLVIMPRLLVRKPLARWRLEFYDEAGMMMGADEGRGNLPEHFRWHGQGWDGILQDGIYEIKVEARDRAGNTASVSRKVELRRSGPPVKLTANTNGDEMTVDLEQQSKVPLAFWHLEMWSKEGRLIGSAEGEELPARVDLAPDAGEVEDLRGRLVVQDILGNRTRRDLQDLTRQPSAAEKSREEEPAGLSESWVEEF